MRGSAFLLSLVLFAMPVAVAADSAPTIPEAVAAAVNDPARPAEDRAHDADRRPAETVAFSGIKAGDRVLELVPGGGYFTRILSKLVGPTGNVYAFTPAELLKVFPKAADGSRAIAADPQYSNVSVIVSPLTAGGLPRALDAIWTTQNYHDLHLAKFFPGLDIRTYNKAMLTALRPGCLYFVSDHEAQPGSGLRDTTLHRIDAEVVRTQITQAGFVFDGEASVLRNPDDPHTASVFDPTVRGKTDQFIFRFRRPAR